MFGRILNTGGSSLYCNGFQHSMGVFEEVYPLTGAYYFDVRIKNSSSVLTSMACHLFSSVFRSFIRMFHRKIISLIACFCCSRGLSVPCLLNPAGRTNRMASYSGRSHMNRVTPWGPESWRVAEHPFMWQPAACFGFETGREITCPETD